MVRMAGMVRSHTPPCSVLSTIARLFLLWVATVAASCPPPPVVTVPATDSTPPSVSMDVAGVPRQPGASSDEPLIHISESCCDLSRQVGSRTEMSFIASAQDPDGGMIGLVISADVTKTCTSGALGTRSQEATTVAQRSATVNADGTAPIELLTQGWINVASYACPTGSTLSLSGDVVAEAENARGGKSKTKVFTFTR